MSAEPRRNVPVPLRTEVTLPDGSVRVEYAVNLSSGGICLHARELLPEQTLRISLEIPGGMRVEASARMVWYASSGGAESPESERFVETGLSFVEIDDETQRALALWAVQPIDRRR